MTTRCEGCGRPGSTCWTMPCLVLEKALAAGPRAVFAWGKSVRAEIRPPGELRLPKDGGIVPSPDAPRVHTSRGGASWVTRDTDGLHYVWERRGSEERWLYAYRAKTPAVAHSRRLAKIVLT